MRKIIDYKSNKCQGNSRTFISNDWNFRLSLKSHKFEIIQQMENIKIVTSRITKNLWALIALVFILTSAVNAQNCPITVSGNECVDAPIFFTGASTGTTHSWTFKDAAGGTYTTSGQSTVSYSFLAPGQATVEYETTINGQTCKSSTKLNIRPKPEIKLTRSSIREQCFEKNLFCFNDSSEVDATNGGGKIKESRYLLSDGQSFSYKYPPSDLPNEVCFSIKDERGGTFDIYIEVEDEYGCVDTVNWQGAMFIYEKIGTAFASNKPIGCDSVEAKITNATRLNKNLVDSIIWNWGDGTKEQAKNNTGDQTEQDLFDKLWGPQYSKWFYGQGTYNSTLIVTTLQGCVDSFVVKAVATVNASKAKIIANKDSTCMSAPEIEFTVDQVPSGASGLLWNFGDPNSGPQNFNNKTWSPSHSFTGLGPFLVNLTYKHPICGNQSIYDTIIILGPASTIDVMGDRIPDWQVFQCPKDVMDTVFFRNYSTFYHNDPDFTDDDSTFYKATGGLGHTFQVDANGNPIQIWQPPVRWEANSRGDTTVYAPAGGSAAPGGGGDPLKRERWCATRLWDFGDNFGAKCTTDILHNKNVTVNCNYSHDTIPYHYYKSWDLVMLSDFKMTPMEDAIFIDSNGLCKRLLVYADSWFYIFDDTMIAVPPTSADSASYTASGNKGSVIFRREKKVVGPAERYQEDFIRIRLGANDSAWIGPQEGTKTLVVGPKDTILLKPEDVVILTSPTDSFEYLYTEHLRRDTLPGNLLKIRLNKGEYITPIDSFRQIPQGIEKYDWIIDYNRFRELYYARIPSCNSVRLVHKDTCHPFKCESEATKQLAMLHANAGGVGSGLIKDAIECLGALNPTYGITFILSDLKPGCSFTDVQINYDTFSFPTNQAASWNKLPALFPGGRPLNPPAPWWATAYNMSGNPPNQFSMQYSASMVGGPNSCITVGIVVGNGIAKPGGNSAQRPLCSDTHYYDKFACFPMIDPAMEVANLTPQSWGGYKICKWDEVIVKPIDANLTVTRDLKSLRWLFINNNAGPGYGMSWLRYIDEDYYHYQDSVPGKNPDYIYNYIVRTKYAEDPYQIECTNDWANGKARIVEGPDTIFTAEIRDYTIAADISKVWDRIKTRLEDRGFDPFALADTTIAKMIWNNQGTIGQPQTGAYGCIDTAGYGRDIEFYFVPNPAETTILHYRDSTITPIDSHQINGAWVHGYKFVPEYAGYHIAGLSMTSDNGECVAFDGKPIIVGFAMFMDKFTDSIVCRNDGESLTIAPDYRYFNIDPQNNGTWDWNYYWNADPAQNPTQYDYWKDPARYGQAGKEPPTRWDWSKEDDDPNDANTIFGNAPYGASGMPGSTNNPWVQLGGGSNLYYKNDSGVYTFRNIAGDSTGCRDTITKRVFISRLDVNFGLQLDGLGKCTPTIKFTDSSVLHDPCNWAVKNCNGPTPTVCDYMKQLYIDWGDGKTVQYNKNSVNDEALPDAASHLYTRNGTFQIVLKVLTDQGCGDSLVKEIKIPGPIPRFEFGTKAGNFVTICVDDSLDFKNTSVDPSSFANFTWFWGDNSFTNADTANMNNNLWHKYTQPGLYEVYLEQVDTLMIDGEMKFCKSIYPDTLSGQEKFQILVLPRDSVRGQILKAAICPGDSNTFIDNSDTILKVYKWKFEHYSTAQGQWVTDTVTTNLTQYTKTFTDPGVYRVLHYAEYDPSHPRPWCPTEMDTLTFLVDSVYSDFDIDSASKPDFTFTRTDVNGVEWRWGFGHTHDITKQLPNDFIENLKSDEVKVKWSYDSSNTYWVCLITKNSTGCEDTICKPVVVDLFIYLANVFTPGEDGLNDTYRVPIQGQDLFEIRIFNRWGERVFFSEDPKKQWNGKINNDGPDAPSGTYFYQLQYRFKGKDKINYVNGSVNLLRPSK